MQINSENPNLAADIIIAELNNFEFESYENNGKIIDAYISERKFNDKIINYLKTINIPVIKKIRISKKLLKSENWNKIWENNFKPVLIKNNLILDSYKTKNNWALGVFIKN